MTVLTERATTLRMQGFRIREAVVLDTILTAAGVGDGDVAATQADITAAINALVNAAPGALNTLKELADALGDDANFAATVTTALAGKQPLDSDLTAIAALTTTSTGRSLLAAADAAALRTILGLGTAATTATTAYDASGAAAAAQAASQPLASTLTALAAVATPSTIGKSLLTAADAAALRTILALGTAATQASSAFDASGAAAAAQAASQPLDSDLTAIAALTTTTFGRAFLALADAAATRTAIGLVLGTDIYSKAAVDSGFVPLAGKNSLSSSRIVGYTTSGAAPTTGTWAAGDVIEDVTYGVSYLCTVGGTPGTWIVLGSGRTLALSKTTSASAAIGSTATELAVIASITVTAGPLPLVISARTNATSGMTSGGLITFAVFDEAFTDVFQDSFTAVAATGRAMSLETTESYAVGTVKTFHLYGRCQSAGTAVFGTATGATCTWMKVALG